MYRITIERTHETTETGGPKSEPYEIYAQSFEELDVCALILRINHQPRTRGPRKKKGEAK